MNAAHSRWLTITLVAQMALGLLTMTINLPSMLDWPRIFGATQAQVQLSFGAFVAAYGAAQLVHGSLSDRIGRRPVIMAGLFICLAGSVLGAFADNVWSLTIARALQGAGAAAGMVVGRAMVQDFFNGADRTRMMAFVGMTLGVCPPVAMVIGGQMHVRLGWQSCFVLIAALTVLALVLAWRILPAPAPVAKEDRQGAGLTTILANYGELLRNPSLLLYVVILASAAATFYAYLGGAPLLLARYAVPPEQIGWYMMSVPLSYIAGNILTTKLVHACGERSIMNMGQTITLGGLSLVLLLGLAGVNTPSALALSMILLGIGHGLLMPPALSGTVGLVPALAGSASALAGLLQQMTGAFGGFAVGLVSHDTSVNLGAQMTGWALIGVVAQYFLYRALKA